MNELSDGKLLESKVILRPDEVARILRVTKRTVYNLCYDGTLDTIKVRGCLRIRSKSVKGLIEGAVDKG